MLASVWLAIAGLPVFVQPFSATPDTPATIALAAGQISLRRPCLTLECKDAGWTQDNVMTYAYRDGDQPARAEPLPGARVPGTPGMRLAGSPGEWMEAEARLDRLGARYGVRAIDTGKTDLNIEVGTGYRFQPYVDEGSANTGVVARGRIELTTQLSERTQIMQQTRFETGKDSTMIRNSLGIEVQLMPQWSLRSDLETRRDTAVTGSNQRNTEGSLKLKRTF